MKHKIALIVGYPAAGKTSLTTAYKQMGYKQVSRDLLGGSLEDFHKKAEIFLKINPDNYVIDNTYPSVESRKTIIDIAKALGYEITCVHLNTSLEDAQQNAVGRMIQKYGKLLSPEEIKLSKDPNCFPPAPMYKYKKEFQKPTASEGFDEVKVVPFVRNAYPAEFKNKAIIVDYDGTLRETISGDKFPTDPKDIKILPNRKETLQKYIDQGYLILGVSNQSGIAKGALSDQTAKDCFKKTNELVGIDIDVKYCSHSVPPIICFCRKPLPGLGVELIHQYKLNPALCIMVGDMTSDKTFAQRSGFQFVNQEIFFK